MAIYHILTLHVLFRVGIVIFPRNINSRDGFIWGWGMQADGRGAH
jgi:hypothetical protein